MTFAHWSFSARKKRPNSAGVEPTIAVTSPSASASIDTAAATLTLAGTASDDRAIARVTWVNDRGGSGLAHQDAASASVNWSAANIALADGSNNIVLRAYDKAGNSVTKTLQVQYVAATPQPTSPDPAPAPNPTQPTPAPIPTPPNNPMITAPNELH